MDAITYDDRVLVAGGGPVGLILALGLARKGIPVTILEAESSPIADPRGAAFHPPTLDVLDELGVLDPLMRVGLQVPVWQVRDRSGDVVAEFDLGLLQAQTRFPFRFHLGQQKVVPILLTALAAEPSATVRSGWRIRDFEEGEDGVRVIGVTSSGAEAEVTGRWLVGADGARSTVRKVAGIDFAGFTWPERFVVTNLADDLGVHGFAWTNYVTDPDRWAVVLRLEDEQGGPNWRVTYPTVPSLSDADALEPADVQERLRDAIGGDRPFKVRYAGLYRVHQRIAEQFRRGRVMLIGDAAHINNPLGGFGLNSGVHDAANLAAKLSEVWYGRADQDQLDLYDRQRRQINIQFVQKASIRNKQMVQERDPEVRARAHAELRRTAADPELAMAYLLETSMINSIHQAAAIR